MGELKKKLMREGKYAGKPAVPTAKLSPLGANRRPRPPRFDLLPVKAQAAILVAMSEANKHKR